MTIGGGRTDVLRGTLDLMVLKTLDGVMAPLLRLSPDP